MNNLAGLGAVNLRLASSALQNFCNLDAADNTGHHESWMLVIQNLSSWMIAPILFQKKQYNGLLLDIYRIFTNLVKSNVIGHLQSAVYK